MKKLIFGCAAALLLGTACSHSKKAVVNGELPERLANAKVLLISLSQGDTLASTTADGTAFTFEQEVESPILIQVRADGRSLGNFILEPGVISFTSEGASGTPLNSTLAGVGEYNGEIYGQLTALSQMDSVPADEMQALMDAMNAYNDSVMMANIDNPVGASLLLDKSYDMELAQLEEMVAAHPSLGDYSKIQQIIHHKQVAAETAEGKPYKDFEIEYEGTVTKLSDLMQPGHYTLVDFWASWCGPCRREMPVIKDILAEYGPKGLDVVGVAVWDEPENTKKAMEELEITWPVIINGQTIPTDLYGILGIPTIILIGPDGTILSRGKQDEELKAAVAEQMNK